jgi:hypothetical protein
MKDALGGRLFSVDPVRYILLVSRIGLHGEDPYRDVDMHG